MNWNPLRLVIALIAGLTIATGTVRAQDADSVIDKLKLTTSQHEQIKQLRDKFRTETEKLRTDIKRLLDEEKKLKSAPSPNEDLLRSVLRKRAELEIDLSLALTRYIERLQGILTPEQWELLQKFKKNKGK